MTGADRNVDRESQRDASSMLPAGRRVASRYEIESVIGEGTSGVVYLARRIEGGGRVALKVIHRHLHHDRQIFGRFQREAGILKRIEGQHLVKLLDFIEEDGLLIIALEHVDGRSLEERLEERAPLDIAEAVEITLQVCAALGAAHAAGVVHRDLKPANVLIERVGRGAGPHARVVDFGLAKVVHGEHMTTGLTEQDMIFGTPEYMAPEQVRGDDVDPRCDLYAAGVMLYEMVVGAVPFDRGTPMAKMTAHLSEAPPSPRSRQPNNGISTALEAVILRALAKDRDERYPSARALAQALAAARDRPLVIAPTGDTDPNVATSDTDLQVVTVGLTPATALPSDKILEPADALAKTGKYDVGAALVPAASAAARKGGHDRLIWAVVALIAAAVGVTIGILFGTQ
jgi:serine/threonine-protein kinase